MPGTKHAAFRYLNKLIVDFCCICGAEVSGEDSGDYVPHAPLCAAAAAAAAGSHAQCSSPLPHWTYYQIQFGLWPNGVIT